jgi:YVTN family beta-propeller protein
MVVGNPIPVGDHPIAIAFDSANGNLYVANENSETVSVISGKTNTLVGNPIRVGGDPTAIAFDSANGNLYVVNADAVSVISGQTNTVVGSPIPVGTAPTGIAFDSANGKLYVTNSQSDDVSVISGQTNTVVGSPISVGQVPTAIAFDSANGKLYVTNFGSNNVSVISGSTNTVIGNPIPVGGGPFAVAFDSANGNIYVVNVSSETVSLISTISLQPPHTTITSAVDGNNAPVQNGGTTTSSSIKIAFTATQGSNPIAGFQCSLDNSPFSSCSSPAVFNNLAGQHKFAVVAIDNAGNKDPNPAIFSWTILTPTQAIQQLIQLKHSMHLDPVTDQTLDIRLNIALQFGQNNIKSGTCLQLNVFISQVQSALRVGHVTSAQASQLIQGAQNIQTTLGCTVASSGIAPSSLSALSTSPLNFTRGQQQQPQTTDSSPSLLQPQPQSHLYTNQYRYPSQYPHLFQIPRSQPPQYQQPPSVNQR